jgi:hypothetical protein
VNAVFVQHWDVKGVATTSELQKVLEQSHGFMALIVCYVACFCLFGLPTKAINIVYVEN